MKLHIKILLAAALLSNAVLAQISACSWNIANFGQSKDEKEISYIAKTIQDYDVIAIIEVVGGPEGPKAVERLASKLAETTNDRWGYTVSDLTTSANKGECERYAFIWKRNKLKIKEAWLEDKFNKKLIREPFFITLNFADKSFTLAAFHAVPATKHPEKEIPHLKNIVTEYPKANIIFCGDFNCPQSDSAAFKPIRSLGFVSAFEDELTSLKKECNGSKCLANAYDNFFYKADKINSKEAGTILFYKDYPTLAKARLISDHIPIYFKFSLK